MARTKGSLNKRTAEERAALAATGELPLDYMLRVMRDPKQDNDRRDEMARAAATYVHPRLSNVESKSETTVRYVARVPNKAQSTEEWLNQHAPNQLPSGPPSQAPKPH